MCQCIDLLMLFKEIINSTTHDTQRIVLFNINKLS